MFQRKTLLSSCAHALGAALILSGTSVSAGELFNRAIENTTGDLANDPQIRIEGLGGIATEILEDPTSAPVVSRRPRLDCLARPASNVAGYLDPILPALFVRPFDEGQVLGALNARPMGPDFVEIDVLALDGSLRALTMPIIRVDEPARSVRPAEQITELADYKVYKNAECKFVDAWAPIPCGPHPGTAQHSTITYNPRHKCLQGSGYCVEVHAIWWVRTFFDDAGCTLAVKIDFGKDSLCKP